MYVLKLNQPRFLLERLIQLDILIRKEKCILLKMSQTSKIYKQQMDNTISQNSPRENNVCCLHKTSLMA